MGRRKELVPPGSFEKRQFHNLSDVRREMVTLYWQAKSGRVDSRIAPSLVRLLAEARDLSYSYFPGTIFNH